MDNLHVLTIDNRKKVTATGILEVASFSDREIKLIVKDKTVLFLNGNNLKILGFDNQSGNFMLTGEIVSFKYRGKEESLIKKVFK